jgi:hypothetical protein
MLKKTIRKASVRCEFDFFLDGSVLADTVQAGVTEFRTFLEIDSPEPDEVVARIIRTAKRGCYAEQLVTTPVPLVSTYQVNGRPFQVDLT